jgi:hypothetical protein
MAEPKPESLRAPRTPAPDGGPDPFTIWLRVSLRRLHDAVAAEPVPEALRRLAVGEDAEPRAAPAPTPPPEAPGGPLPEGPPLEPTVAPPAAVPVPSIRAHRPGAAPDLPPRALEHRSSGWGEVP